MTKLGIIGAMDQEVETLVAAMGNCKEETVAGSRFFEGTLEGLPAVVVQCGIGKVNAALCAQILCSNYQVTHLVNTGIAGSLSPELDIADLVISQDAMYHDFDCTEFGYPYGQFPRMDTLAFPADEAMMAWAFAAAEALNPGHAKIGRVASGDQFIAERARKARIKADFDAMCCEMEGAPIAQVCWLNEIPFVIVRAISDKADGSKKVLYPIFEKRSAERCAKIVGELARRMA